MKCWICKRQAGGFRHSDTRHGIWDPQHYPTDWVFCSKKCLDTFHVLYKNWLLVLKEGHEAVKEVAVIDPTDFETSAMRQCLKAFGEAAGEIGFAKPLGEYSEAEALQVIDAIVTSYSLAMVSHHEKTKLPPVRGMPPAPDPMATVMANPMATAMANPFADLKDTPPWETKP